MKKILVTGGAGFIGSNLCRKLLEYDNEIFCLDDFSTGKLENIEDLKENKNFYLINLDVRQEEVKTLFKDSLDEIYNLASPASPKHYQSDPLKTFETNVLGTMNLVQLANINDAKLLQASTSEIYGNAVCLPTIETYWGEVNPIGIRSCYDESKRATESYLFDYKRVNKLDIKVARIFNTYGPGMSIDDGRVIPNFIVQALKGEDITVYGDGQQTRSFQYIDDLINGLIKLMASKEAGPINIGNPQNVDMLFLAKKIKDFTNSKSKIIYKELPKDDPQNRIPDISLAKEKLNWKPEVSLYDGLYKTIKYFEDKLKMT